MKIWENPDISILKFDLEDSLTTSSVMQSSEITFEDED